MLFLPVTLFWATFEQQGNTLVLWSADQTDRTINLLFWSGEIPVTFFPALNGLMGFVLLLLVIRLWAWQGKHSLEPSSIAKMAIGCFCLALSLSCAGGRRLGRATGKLRRAQQCSPRTTRSHNLRWGLVRGPAPCAPRPSALRPWE
jgi:dipeptide/tripeptide permease